MALILRNALELYYYLNDEASAQAETCKVGENGCSWTCKREQLAPGQVTCLAIPGTPETCVVGSSTSVCGTTCTCSQAETCKVGENGCSWTCKREQLAPGQFTCLAIPGTPETCVVGSSTSVCGTTCTCYPRVKDFLLMSNPFPTIAILTVYLYFILKWGPNFMRDRKPFNLDTLMIVYNIVQIIACCMLLKQGWNYAYGLGYSLFCEPVDYSPNPDAIEVARACHAYYLLKIADLLDTVFFVLRKKDNQVSFLHLYHHTGMVVLTWTATKFLPGGHSIFTGFINSIIHIVMYSYYLVTAFSPKYKNNVWWKKYITQMQIIQFFMIGTHWAALLFQDSCGYPLWPVAIMIPQNFFMLALFGDFYRKAYILKRPKTAPVQENGTKKLSNGTTNVSNGTHPNGVHKNGFMSNGSNGSLINGLTKRANGVSIASDTSNMLQRHLATSQQFDNL